MLLAFGIIAFVFNAIAFSSAFLISLIWWGWSTTARWFAVLAGVLAIVFWTGLIKLLLRLT